MTPAIGWGYFCIGYLSFFAYDCFVVTNNQSRNGLSMCQLECPAICRLKVSFDLNFIRDLTASN